MTTITMCAFAAIAGGIVCGVVSAAVFYKLGFDEGYDAAVRAMSDELKKGIAK